VGGGKVGEPKQNMVALGIDVVRLWGLMHEDKDPKSEGDEKMQPLFVRGRFLGESEAELLQRLDRGEGMKTDNDTTYMRQLFYTRTTPAARTAISDNVTFLSLKVTCIKFKCFYQIYNVIQ